MNHSIPHYRHPNYLSPKRLSSIAFQYKLAVETGADLFLEIGPGSKFLCDMLAAINRTILTFDSDFSLDPSVNGSLPVLPFKDNAFEVVMAFQVLEHLPFEMFELCLAQMARISSTHILLSVPDRGAVETNKLRSMPRKDRIVQRLKNGSDSAEIDSAHAWELGVMNIDVDSIQLAANNIGWTIERHFLNECWVWHHFFVFVPAR